MTRAESLAQARRVIHRIVAERHDRPSLVPRIASEIGAEIVEGHIPPGHDLNTVDLARRYQTSRTPVREALLLLDREGLVDLPPRRRPTAHVHTIQDVREAYTTRTVIFELIATEVAERAGEREIAMLEQVLTYMRQAVERGDPTAFTWLSVHFHEIETRISGNRTAKRIHDSLLLRMLAIRRLAIAQPGRLAQSMEDHVQLVKAYSGGQAHLAGAIMRASHIASREAIELYHENGGALVAPSAP
ncbi:GntR family transcriptional regulator [Seohaeicola nanhaiensis]|uniref:GntR family transcriptional regulator n=1 Tax=Seohaeicola nanhaiensis TaxID=1387282 RepID=A0ABV9KH79_9RHOB